MTRNKVLTWVHWFALISLFYFVFSGILSYMKASGVEIYVIKYNAIEHKLTFEHIVDDGEHGNENIKKEVERED